jgi:hypothetical protein
MNNTELITTIISVILSLVSIGLGYWSKRNSKAKVYYETFIKVEEQIRKLCIDAEKNYTKGDQKKKYVISNINQFLLDQKITIDLDTIDGIIESIINVSKQINTISKK